MKKLAPNLFERRFQDLMEIGRAKIPALAPEWTDHNAHDPGITLMELLAWVAEAQLYSLSRVRRDERASYAALMGIKASGSRSASGMIWSDPNDPDSPAITHQRTTVIPEDATIRILGSDTPIFTPTNRLLWIPGEIEKLETRSNGGQRTDHTKTNEHGRAAFFAFGGGGPRDVLSIRYKTRDRAGMFGIDRTAAKDAYWPLGFRVVSKTGEVASPEPYHPDRSSLTATFIAGGERVSLGIVSDTTNGLLRTGVVMLDLENVRGLHTEFSIELRSPAGFAIPPRLSRIEPNVIPIVQEKAITSEVHDANGSPDLNFALNETGVKFDAGQEPVRVEVLDNGLSTPWRRCDELSTCGPRDTVYEFDLAKDEITFGNGVNGAVPPPNSKVVVAYKVCDDEAGNIARNRKWSVSGFAGAFGINPEPIAGGAASSDMRRQRRDARAKFRSEHALITPADIKAAARNLPSLQVARAWIVLPDSQSPRSGEINLVVLRDRGEQPEPNEGLENSRWLTAIRRQLVTRIPLGARLVVKRPDYSDFRIEGEVEVVRGFDPQVVEKSIKVRLRERIALTGPKSRQPGIALSKSDVTAWIRAVEGVQRISKLQLRGKDGKANDSIKVSRGGLPRWNEGESRIEVVRS